jgi:uncharacterized membrane protein
VNRKVAAVFAATLVILFVVVFPWALDSLLVRFGTRSTAVVLAVLVAAALPLRSQVPVASPVGAIGIATLLLGAAVTGDRVFLRLTPASIYFGLAWAAAASLRGGSSLIERGARFLVPEAPAFVGPYCRVVTALWAVFFFACALVIAVLALSAPADAWRTFTGRTVWVVMASLSALEFFVRKTWFRYYFRDGAFDRFWSRLFPAERTERGRRSMEAIRIYRERNAVDAANRNGTGPPTSA